MAIFHSLPRNLDITQPSPGPLKAWAVWSSGEWLRRKPFDVRHAVECMKLYWMCDSAGEAVGIPIPAGNNPQESWMSRWATAVGMCEECFQMNQPYPPKNDHISRLGKRKIIFKGALVRDMLVPRRVFLVARTKSEVWQAPISRPLDLKLGGFPPWYSH